MQAGANPTESFDTLLQNVDIVNRGLDFSYFMLLAIDCPSIYSTDVPCQTRVTDARYKM